MMIKQIPCLLLLAAIAGGCATAPSRFYNLTATAMSDGTHTANYAVAVGPVSVPALVDRPQFTVQIAPNRVMIDEFNRWAAPLNDSIARVVAADLAVLLGTPRVATTPLVNFDPAYRVTINVLRFESHQSTALNNEGVLVEVVWVVSRAAGGAARSGHTIARDPATGDGFAALAAGHSRALAKVSADIADAIRADAGANP